MSIQEESDTAVLEQAVSEQQVVDYLRNKPDLLLRNPSLLSQIRIPHDSGDGTISLIEHQVRLLREQNGQLKHKLMELVHVARDNDRLAERMMHLTLSLMEADSLEQILEVLQNTLDKEFKADSTAVRLFSPALQLQARYPHTFCLYDTAAKKIFSEFFAAGRPLCGRLRAEQLAFLFAEQADTVHSAVLIPLGDHHALGMIAIGSKDKNRFHPGMGTVFLKQMGTLISAVLKRHLPVATENG